MSLPRQIPSHSSSPSKTSLRRTSGAQQPIPKSLLPSPHFYESLPDRTPAEQGVDHDEIVEEEPAKPEPSYFQPFFTLIEDSVTNEHYHPTVHYIFADDDADIITEAAFRSLELDQEAELQDKSRSRAPEEEDEGRLPPHDSNVREHYLILDVHPTGNGSSCEVTSAKSLSAEWQVLRSNITTAPTFNAEAPDAEDGLMLKIEGRGNTPPDAEGEKSKAGKDTESLEEMVERFQKRLDDIKKALGAGNDLGGGPSQEHLTE